MIPIQQRGGEKMDYRHEVKHVITAGDAAAIRTNMSAVAHLDPHAKEKGYYRIGSEVCILTIRWIRRCVKSWTA